MEKLSATIITTDGKLSGPKSFFRKRFRVKRQFTSTSVQVSVTSNGETTTSRNTEYVFKVEYKKWSWFYYYSTHHIFSNLEDAITCIETEINNIVYKN